MINSKSIYFAFILLVASSLFWSGNFFTGKVASLYNLTPFKLSFLRWSLAFLLLLPFTYRKIFEDFEKYKKNLFLHFWGVLWSVLDENWRKSSRNLPEPPYLPQNPIFLQENQKNVARENC